MSSLFRETALFKMLTMKTTIENIDIWQCKDALYFKRSDGHLLKMQGSHMEKVLNVIRFIAQEKPLSEFKDNSISREELGEIVKFLLQNQIICQRHSNTQGHICHKSVGVYAADDVVNVLNERLQPEGYQLRFKQVRTTEDLLGIQFLLVISPVFDHYRELEELSKVCYQREIPLMYAEFSPSSFCIGPIVEPRWHTPSLACYMKRKKVNLNNLDLYAEFIAADDKEQVHAVKVTEFPYFNIGMELLKTELFYFWKYQGKLSTRLMGKSVVLDFIQYRSEQSQVLKDPGSSLFAKTPFVPFNA